MHCRIYFPYDVSRDPARFFNTALVVDSAEDGVLIFLELHGTELEEW